MTQDTPTNSSAPAASEQSMPVRNPDSVEVTPRLLKHCDNAIFGSVNDPKSEALWKAIRNDLEARNELGIKTYSTPLYIHNGRSMLLDAYQEALDMIKYYQGYVLEKNRTTDYTLMKMLTILELLKGFLNEGEVEGVPPP